MRRILPAALAALATLAPAAAYAVNRTAWTPGNGVGYTWTSIFATGDLTSLPSGDSILSTNTVTNQTAQDIYADVSCVVTVASSTPTTGAYIGIYLVPLNGDGTTYGDGEFTAGTQTAATPPYAPVGSLPIQAVSLTQMSGDATAIVVPPGTFKWLVYNGTGVTFSATAANNKCWYRTYNINLNQ